MLLVCFVCYSLMNSPNIRTSQKQGKMVGCKDTSDVPQKAAEVTNKESNNWPTVSFIPNGSEITTCMGHSFKTKNTKSKATFLR